MTSGPGPRFPRTGTAQSLVEMLSAYSNPAEQVRKLRAGLAGALPRDDSPEQPGTATTSRGRVR
jgi:hypothetical protein